MNTPRPSRRHGFTLVEIIIAIGIFSIIVTAIYACWSAVLRSSTVGMEAAARAQRARIAEETLREALTYATMHTINQDLYTFEGSSGEKRLSFVAKLPSDFRRGGRFPGQTLRRLEFKVEELITGGSGLVLRQAPLMQPFDDVEDLYPLPLARNVEKLEIEFWDVEEEDWIDEWVNTNAIPALVRVSLATRHGKNNKSKLKETTMVIKPASEAVMPQIQGARGLPPR